MIEQLIHSVLQQLEVPRADLEKNLHALFSEMVTKLELVSKRHDQLEQRQSSADD